MVALRAVPALSDSQFVIVRVFYLILLYVSIQFRLSLNPRHCSVGLSVFVDISPYKKEPFLALLLRLIYLVVTPSLVFTKAWFGINLRSNRLVFPELTDFNYLKITFQEASFQSPLLDKTPNADAVSARLILLAFAAVPTYDIAVPKSPNPVEVASAE